MSKPTPTRPSADRNLLFGVLALQMDFITRDALIRAMNAWAIDKSKPLGQVLAEQGVLRDDARTLLEALVQKHLELHGNNAEQSLAAVSSAGSIRQQLQQIANPDVQASLANWATIPPANSDPHATHASSAGSTDDPYATRAPLPTAPAGSSLRYRILRPHARGGLGEVFVAQDEELHREVALKEIQDRHADHPESRSRFLLEAEITGGLEHPGIVPVYGLGTYADGRPYYAMRFIKGDSLQDAIRRFHQADVPGRDSGERALALRQLLRRFVDVCNAIAYAHARGVLHRDLKPGNIMLGQYGETLVVDWGLAKPLGQGQGDGGSSERTLMPSSASGSAVTQMGSAIGTPAYMSPEQAAGRLDELGPAADVYSLGATLYCLLTGKPPFTDPDVGLVLANAQLGEFPRPRKVKSDVPVPLEAICLKAMALKPRDRYESPRALADDVEHWLADEPVSAWREPARVRARRWVGKHRALMTAAAAAAAVALTASALGLILLAAANERESEAREKESLARQDAEAQREKVAGALAVLKAQHSQLARSFCEVSDSEFQRGHYRDSLNWMLRAYETSPEDDPTRQSFRQLLAAQGGVMGKALPHDRPVEGISFSPDGRFVLTADSGTVRLWGSASCKPIASFPHHNSWLPSFSPDGRLLLGSDSSENGAVLWDVAGREPAVSLLSKGRVICAEFSLDGRRVLTASQDCTARIWDVATGREVAVLHHDSPLDFARFSPDGNRVLTVALEGPPAAAVGSGAAADLLRLKPGDHGLGSTEMEVRLWEVATAREHTILHHDRPVRSALFSPDGQLILTRTVLDDFGSRPESFVQLWEAATGKQRALLSHQDSVEEAVFSPDGRLVLTASLDHTALLWEAGTGNKVAVLHHKKAVFSAAMSRDGRFVLTLELAAASAPYFTNQLTVRLWDAATGKELGVIGSEGNDTGAWFSPDSRLVVTTSNDNMARLWDVSSRAELTTLGTENRVIGARFSPDSQLVVTCSWNSSEARLWSISAGQSVVIRSKNHMESARFSPDGRRVLTRTAVETVIPGKEGFLPDKAAELWDSRTGQPVATLSHEQSVGAASFSPDGHLVLTVSHDKTARLWQAATGENHAVLRHDDWVQEGFFSPDSRLVITIGGGRRALLWDAATGKELARLHHGGKVEAASFSPESRLLLTTGSDRMAILCDAGTGKELLSFPLAQIVRRAVFSPDACRVLTTSEDRDTAKLWDTATGKLIAIFKQDHEDGVTYGLEFGMFSPDGRLVLTASRNARLWEASTGRLLATLPTRGGAFSAMFSPDGRLVLIRDESPLVRLWESASGKLIAEFVHDGQTDEAVFSPDSRLVLTVCRSEARLWDTATGKQLFPAHGWHSGGRRQNTSRGFTIGEDEGHAEFSPNGRVILATSTGSTSVHLWQVVEPVPSDKDWLLAWVGVRTGKAFDDKGLLRDLSQAERLQFWRELEAKGGDLP